MRRFRLSEIERKLCFRIHCFYSFGSFEYRQKQCRIWIYKHRHQRWKTPSLCKTFSITINGRSKETVQKKYLSHNDFVIKHLSHNVYLTTSFSQCLSHNVFLTTSFSQRLSNNFLSHTVALTYSSTQVVLTTLRYTCNLSVLYKYSKISQYLSEP